MFALLLKRSVAWPLVFISLPSASAQLGPSANLPQFETISIRRSSPKSRIRIDFTPDGYIATGMPLQPTIVIAYSYRYGDPQFMTGRRSIPGAPGWLTSDQYDIYAKLSEADTIRLQALSKNEREEQIRLAIRALLVERFQLKVRRPTENVAGYVVLVSSKGLKLKATPTDASGGARNSRFLAKPGNITAVGGDMKALVFCLVGALHTPVIDKTGLIGKYDFTLNYTPDEPQPGGASTAQGADYAPSIFTAIEEQLGLKLQRTTVPEESLVIDRVKRPSEN